MSVRNTHISTYFANYILHMSSKIVCVYEIFFQCPPEMEVMTKTNSVKSERGLFGACKSMKT